jgi:hypothetical protein
MAIEDIIPLDILLGKHGEGEPLHENPKKKKKVDREAMASPIMRIPRMDVRVVRDLLDIGIRELYELRGRAAESIFEEVKKRKPNTPEWTLAYLRMAVYFCEEENPEAQKLHPQFWTG